MTDYCYPKAKRLLKPREFKQVFNQPIFKVHQTHLMVFAYASSDSQLQLGGDESELAHTELETVESEVSELTQARLGMAITKKKIPTAVVRNRLKRLIREQFRLNHKQLPALDLVFIVKKSPQALSNAQLQQEIQELLRKVRNNYARLQKTKPQQPGSAK